jgi:hypothetical protein
LFLFVGISLLANGPLIFGEGLNGYLHPPVQRVVWYHVHANIWWGTLAAIGAGYCIYFALGKGRG